MNAIQNCQLILKIWVKQVKLPFVNKASSIHLFIFKENISELLLLKALKRKLNIVTINIKFDESKLLFKLVFSFKNSTFFSADSIVWLF